jgi:hypothetical protein|tara:strand:+ start:114 stop:497 length:384 start_codon:yes stop_codon:yes gene_type:complete
MALVLNDRVKVTTTTSGTGAFALGAAAQGFETFAVGIGNSNETYYAAYENATNNFEVGRGTLDGTSANLARTEVISSSNSDNLVNFTGNSTEVFCTLPASKAVYLDANGVPVGAASNGFSVAMAIAL